MDIEDHVKSPMSSYRLGQVEDAIFRSLGAENARAREVKYRLKRLLAADRGLGRPSRSESELERRFAFFPDAPPGRGVDIMFSHYAAFALLAAVILLEHGLPQKTVVTLMRRVRQQLESAHAQCLKKDPKILFDEERLRQQARPGMIAFSATEPVVLIAAGLRDAVGNDQERIAAAVCQSPEELGVFARQHGGLGRGYSIVEFTSWIHDFAKNLSRAPARKRGRQSAGSQSAP
jgi:hypothetical protein